LFLKSSEIQDLNACLDRFVVVDDAKEEKKPEEHTPDKVEVDLVLEDWAISVLDVNGDSFGIRGEALRIGGSPPRSVREEQVTTAVSSVQIGMGTLLIELR